MELIDKLQSLEPETLSRRVVFDMYPNDLDYQEIKQVGILPDGRILLD